MINTKRQTTAAMMTITLQVFLLLLSSKYYYPHFTISAQPTDTSTSPSVAVNEQQQHCSVDGSCYFDILNPDSSDDDDDSSDDDDYNEDDEMNKQQQPRQLPPQLLQKLYTTLHTHPPLKQLERTHHRITHPTALSSTLQQSGNYTTGHVAGSPSWIGTINSQLYHTPTYTSLGSTLDISTSGSHGGRQDTLPWMGSIVYRNELVHYHGTVMNEENNKEYIKPCRVDLLDDWDAEDVRKGCVLGMTLSNNGGEYVSVLSEGNGDVEGRRGKREWMEYRAREELLLNDDEMFEFVDTLDDIENGRRFDTVIVNGLPLTTISGKSENDVLEGVDVKLEEWMNKYMKKGGMMYVFGEGPVINRGEEWYENGPGEKVFSEIVGLFDSVQSLSGARPEKNPTASFVHRTISRLGLQVVSSTIFPTSYTMDDVTSYLEETVEWIDELDTRKVSYEMKRTFYQLCSDLLYRVEDLKEEGYEEVYSGSYEYMIAARLPSNDDQDTLIPTVDKPTTHTPKEKYRADRDPNVEELSFPPIAPGVMETYKWANGDAYDGLSARIGIPPQLKGTIIEYVKELGIWDIILDTMKRENQMRPDSTKILTLTSPYSGQNFTWSVKRPDNFEGSSSDMHWFDIADEAAHEEALRALAKGGFDEVLNAIGTTLGLDNLVSFSIGILAVTKADKGYVHVDFSKSGKKAANFLVNLQTPGDEPELTVIEEDDVGNRRRAQVKYSDEFGILNGDDAMHATNECNHRANGGVRITASIFISQLEEASLKQVAEHDRYYFPFGNMEWIWAQRGRHWNKEGTVSMMNDKGRQPFVPVDGIDGCEYRVGENKEECMVHGEVRMNCYKTCGFFTDDGDYRPGVERKLVSTNL